MPDTACQLDVEAVGTPRQQQQQQQQQHNHAALAERFQPSTLHKLRQLGPYTNADTPDTAYQLDAEAVGAEVAYTKIGTQSGYSGGREPDRISNAFKKAMGLPQTGRWKAISDKEIASLEKHGGFKLVLILLGKKGGYYHLPERLHEGRNTALRHGRLQLRVHPRSRGGTVPEPTGGKAAEREGEAALPGDYWSRAYILHKSPATASPTWSTSWRGSCPSPRKLTWGGQASASLLGRVYRRLHHLQAGRFRLVAFSDANWGNNPDKSRSTSSYIMMLPTTPISFKVGLQGLTAQSTMNAELVAVALTMKKAMFCSNTILELDFFGSVPLYIDSTSALHVAGNRTYSPRAKHIALR